MERTLSRQERMEIYRMYKEGMTVSEIANETMRSSTTIHRLFRQFGHDFKKNRNKRYADVVRLHLEGAGATKISEETGYSRRQVYNILKVWEQM